MTTVQFYVLGPVKAANDDGYLSLGGNKQRLVLALLLSRPDTSISTDTLIEGVWNGDPPSTARKTLQVYIHRLRGIVGDAIGTDPHGYRFVGASAMVDSHQFTALHTQSTGLEAGEAAETLREALAMWSGPAYADLRDELALRPEVTRLDGLRLEALSDRIEADLALGRHTALIGELEGLTFEHPFHEGFRAQHMTALYRSGRVTEALRSYERHRRFLAEESGIDPSAELRALEERILNQDATLAPSRMDDSAPPAAIRGYELRERVASDEISETYRAYQRSVGRQVAIRVIGSPPADDSVFIANFAADTQRLSEVDHPHIAYVSDAWREPGRAYQVSRWLGGGTLAQKMPLPAGAGIRLLDDVGSALAEAHRSGLVHGRVDASQVAFDESGNVFLTGFAVGRKNMADGQDEDRLAFAALAHLVLGGREPRQGNGHLETHLTESADSGLVSVFDKAFSHEPYQRLEDFLRALRRASGTDVVSGRQAHPSRGESRNPYKGLQAFQESDADDFYGRSEIVDRLVSLTERVRLIAVVGPSGSGKSSIVKAGLVPRLRDSVPLRLITEMYPGPHPFEELERALLRVGVGRSSLIEDLVADAHGLERVIGQVLPPGDAEVVLLIDQFEELFSAVDDQGVHALFLDNLVNAVSEPNSRLRVIVTLRADFFDRPLEHPRFGELVQSGLVAVSLPGDEDLAQATLEPARSVGVEFEVGLVEQIVSEVSGQAGGLPLLQYALTELFESRDSDALEMSAYVRTGGVHRALGRRAEEVYEGMAPPEREAIRQAMLRMVTVDESADDLRRRVRRSELAGISESGPLDAALRAFASARLLTFDHDPVTRGPTVEVAHEALFREWGRLRAWIEEQRSDLVIRRRLDAAATEWKQSGEDASYLPGGGRLSHFDEWARSTTILLSDFERQFLQEALEREATALERRARRRRTLLAGLSGVALVLAVVSVFAFVQRQAANANAAVAAASAEAAETERIASEAVARADKDPSLGLLLAAEAYNRDPGPETLGALQRTMLRTGPYLGVVGHPQNSYVDAKWDAAESVLVAAHTRGLEVYETGKYQLINTVDLVPRGVTGLPRVDSANPVAFDVSGDGQWAAVSTSPGNDVMMLDLRSGSTHRLSHTAPVTALAFSNDGMYIATGDSQGMVTMWASDSMTEVTSFSAHPEQYTEFEAELAPLGASTSIWEQFSVPNNDGVAALTFSPDDTQLVSARIPTVRVWDPVTGEQINEFFPLYEDTGFESGTLWPSLPDRIEIPTDQPATLRMAGYVSLADYDLATGKMLFQARLPTDDPWVTTTLAGATLLPDSEWLVYISDGRVRKLDSSGAPVDTISTGMSVPGRISVNSGGSVGVATGDGGMMLLSLDGRTLLSRTVPGLDGLELLTVSADGAMVAQSGQQAGTSIYEVGPTEVAHMRTEGHGDGLAVTQVIHNAPGRPPVLTRLEWDMERTGDEPWRVTLFDARSGTPLGISGPSQDFAITFSPDGRYYAADSFGTVYVWNIEGAELVTSLPVGDTARSASFSADSARLIVTQQRGPVMMWNTDGWAPASPPTDLGNARVASFSPDGRFLATATSDGVIAIRNAVTFELLRTLVGADPVEESQGHMQWSGDGNHLLSLFDGVPRMWDVESGKQLGDPFPHNRGIWLKGATSDVLRLATSVGDNVQLWNLDPSTWLDTACRAAGRNMTSFEWEQFGPTGAPYRATCPEFPAAVAGE